ncbi:glycosyltransferase [Paenibacillus ihbetae]|uniref:Glycosyltransferase 2-like domain-containing protein n=1 Tax=Paenibacillus ihbetae TaxID=1870820 RepID=A0ABX3K2T0_9BACL|nr:glycosyltransferase [Paenibacillus ihbetae]OOC63744.1 hypothetical protein BBD40_18930 [Paenibacillus ihbetae]
MKTSIIILTYNKLDYTIQCIESIRLYTSPGTYEIIIVDNNSTDGTRDWLEQQDDVISILNENNMGFPRGCNQGIDIASGTNILLLNNDVIVTENWLDNMLNCLYSSNKVGAVSCVTNSCTYLQEIPVDYTDLESMQAFASQYNSKSNPSAWEERLKLIGFCMLIKKSVVDQIGLLDEVFSPGNYEDDDYSTRIRMAGYKLLLCRDTFIHHYGSTSFKENRRYFDLLNRNKKKFIDKWGFNPNKAFYFNPDMVELIDMPIDAEFKLLEVNCGCGGTLLKIKEKFMNSKLYGIEINENAANLSAMVAKRVQADLHFNLSCPEQSFDYIIISDSLQRFYDPNQIVSTMKRYLTPKGKLLMSVPNVMHHSVIKGLLDGEWTYGEYGAMDIDNLRFFTLKEIYKMLLENGYSNLSIIGQNNGTFANPEWVHNLSGVIDKELIPQLDAFQYLVSASNNELGTVIDEIRVASELSIDCLTKLDDFHFDEIFNNIQLVVGADEEALQLLNKIGSWYFEKGDYKRVLPFFQKGLEINSTDTDTLYNVSYFLMFIGETEIATNYIRQLHEVDQNAFNDLLMVLADFKKDAQNV